VGEAEGKTERTGLTLRQQDAKHGAAGSPVHVNSETERLRSEIVRLGPWHLDVCVTPEISTRVALEAKDVHYPSSFGDVKFHNPSTFFTRLLNSLFPTGLAGRSVLDCGCNCGGWLFCAKDQGAGECLGFDARDHWIDQARFLVANRTLPSDRMSFEVCDLYSLPSRRLQPFDMTIFHGIFYHLPDPVRGLKIVADLTKELLFINTATREGLPDGMLVCASEDRQELMSGVHGLCWFPTGPGVMTDILRWLGFPCVRLIFWSHVAPHQPANMGRMQLVAARRPEYLVGLDQVSGGNREK